MKYKNEILIFLINTVLVLLLRYINILQIENGFGNVLSILLMIISLSFITILIQRRIDKNYENKIISYKNLDLLKYISAILIIILHLRPFLNYSIELDLAFNNMITRICVPIFFVITGYFVSKKEKNNPDYIKVYIKKMLPIYLAWSLIYLPVLISEMIGYLPMINSYLVGLNIPFPLFIFLFILFLPILVLIVLCYTGVYYHLWYFPAIMLSLLILKIAKKRIKVKYLLLISFVLLLFGATETYYGVLPMNIKVLVSHYYNIFFTTRNFLFFGLFYVVMGYYMGERKALYSNHCFEKLVISIFCLIFEVILLYDTERINSNILISCIPLTYYLFTSCIYMNNATRVNYPFADLSKYYYLVHPMIIFLMIVVYKKGIESPYLSIVIVILITHVISIALIALKDKYQKLPI